MDPRWIIFTVAVVVFHQLSLTCGNVAPDNVGVCYGTVADNLPSPKDVIDLCLKNHIQMVRIFNPSPEILEALKSSMISVSIGVKNQDLATLSTNQDVANDWVKTNIAPYIDHVPISFITVGNEVIPGPLAQYVVGAMTNIHKALAASKQLGFIKVTTVVSGAALGTSYPPSAGAFSSEVVDVMTQVADYVFQNEAPLMINVYPYFAYASDPNRIPLDYALFKSETPVVVDGNYSYYNLFDAMVDAFNAALEKINLSNVKLAISESGWPSAGNDPYASKENAETYVNNLIKHIRSKSGSPRRPSQAYDLYLFALFNEDSKQAGVEQNFGLYYPNMEPVYPVQF